MQAKVIAACAILACLYLILTDQKKVESKTPAPTAEVEQLKAEVAKLSAKLDAQAAKLDQQGKELAASIEEREKLVHEVASWRAAAAQRAQTVQCATGQCAVQQYATYQRVGPIRRFFRGR